jgi:hypothetical protein
VEGGRKGRQKGGKEGGKEGGKDKLPFCYSAYNLNHLQFV